MGLRPFPSRIPGMSKEDGIIQEQRNGNGARLGMLEKEMIQETSEPFPGPKGAPGELERDWDEGQDTGNGFHRERGDWGGILGRNPWLGWNSQGSIPWGSLGWWERSQPME